MSCAHNRKLTHFAWHETKNGFRASRDRGLAIAAENAATRLIPESWADVARANARAERRGQIHQSWLRTKNI